MPRIPITMSELPTRLEGMDDSIVYTGIIRSLRESPTEDKNGFPFLKMEMEVIAPEQYRSKKVFDNYIPIPPSDFDGSDMAGAAYIMEYCRKLGRIAAAARVTSDDTDDLIGAEIQFTITNEEYPEGSGDRRARPKEYLI